MKKLVVKLKLDVHDDKDRSKAMRVVSSFEGVGSLNMDVNDGKLTVSGDFDPIKMVKKLRKSWNAYIVSVGPAKEDGGKKDKSKKKGDEIPHIPKAYPTYYSPPLIYYDLPYEETPSCVIC